MKIARFLAALLLLSAGLGRVRAQMPVITEQPPLHVFANPGESVTLSVSATGGSAYFWRLNGFDLPDQHSTSISFPSVTLADAGSYSVAITSSTHETVVSKVCVLDVNGPGGAIEFSNLILHQPVYDSDGTTRLVGDAYFAQLYGGSSAATLVPVGAAAPFEVGNRAGYWRGGVRTLPGIPPGNPAVVQVRIWQAGRGRTFEEALSSGSKIAVSDFIAVGSTGGFGIPPTFPSQLEGLTSFRLGPVNPLTITKQPTPIETTVGEPIRLEVGVSGTGVYGFQWQRNGVDIAGATTASFQLAAATTADAGSYRVRVTGVTGSQLSEFVVVGVNEPGGSILFDNATLQVPVVGEEGGFSLAGDRYLAQLYAGPSRATLVPISAAAPFQTGSSAGYWVGGIRTVPNIPEGGTATVQVRVWETSAGPTFEAALAAGQPVGASRILELTLGGGGSPPTSAAGLLGFQKFSLGHAAAPEITRPLEAVFADSEHAFRMTVQATGIEPLIYEWRKNGALIGTTIDGILELSPALLATAGGYEVFVRNPVGQITGGTLAVAALIAPAITVAPIPTAVIAGSRAGLSVVANGTEPIKYQWRRNGLDISGATAATLQWEAIQAGDAGNYSIRVSNPAGIATSDPIALQVLTSPTISVEPEDRTLLVGSTESVSVTAMGTEPLFYQWEFNGRPIPGATGREFPLTSTSLEGSGSYRVRVRNAAGFTVSRFAVVIIQGDGGSVLFSNVGMQAPVTATDGTRLLAGDDFLAQLYVGSDPNSLRAVAGATPFARGAAAGGWRGGTRWIPFLAPGSAAIAQVRVWETAAGTSFEEALTAGRSVGVSALMSVTLGGNGTPPTFPVTLAGLLPFSLASWTIPTIVHAPLSAGLVVGQALHLSVEAAGTGPLQYRWRRDSTVLAANGPVLNISAVEATDAGNYSVEVANLIGRAVSAPVAVQVWVPPTIVIQPRPQIRATGTRAYFEVEVVGSPPFSFQWLRDEIALAIGPVPNYEISAVQPSDAGGYRVRVSNAAGSVLSEAVGLSVGEPPTILKQPDSLTAVAGGDVTVSVVADGTAPVSFQWFRNGELLATATNALLELHAVTAANAGRYQVRVVNPFGTVLSGESQLTVLTTLNLAGTAVDGYISGATVFFDANRNGLLDPGEPMATTDRQGQFSLDISLDRFDRNHDGLIDATEGRLVRLGGVDLATGLRAEMPAIGPAGSKALGPLSSLVDAVQAGSLALSLREAERIVAVGLSLPADLELTQIDPLAAALAGAEGAKPLLNAAAQVQDTLIQVGAVVDAGSGGSLSANASVLDALARRLAAPEPLDLTSPAQIELLIQHSAEREGVQLSSGMIEAASQVVAGGNQTTKDAAQSGTPVEVVGRISRIQSVVQKTTADDLADAVVGFQAEVEVLARHTGEQLTHQIGNTAAGDLFGTESRSGTFSFGSEVPRVLENGQVLQALTVVRTDGNRGAVRVQISLKGDTAVAGSDFDPADLFVDFNDGEVAKTIDLGTIVVDDATPEPIKTFQATLSLVSSVPAGGKLGIHQTTRVDIEDDDTAGSFAFASDILEVTEEGRFVRRLFVERSRGLQGTVNLVVTPRSIPEGASPATDFDPTPLHLTFSPGQRLAQVMVPIIADDLYEPNEEAELELSIGDPSAVGANLGDRRVARLVIVNDDRRMPQLRPSGRTESGVPRGGLQVLGPVGQRIAVEVSADLSQWQQLSDGMIGPTGKFELPFEREAVGRFYRIGAKR